MKKLPKHLRLETHNNTLVLVANEDLYGGYWVLTYAISHPHPAYHPITTPIAEFATISNTPNCEIMNFMQSGGYDWGTRYGPVWSVKMVAKGKWRQPACIKEGEIITIPYVKSSDIPQY